MTLENLNNYQNIEAEEEAKDSSPESITSSKPPLEIDWKAQLNLLANEFHNRAEKIIEKCGPIEHLANPIGSRGMNGFAFSGNIAHWYNIKYNNFFHRTESEKAFHKALVKMNKKIAREKGEEYTFVFSPLSVFVGWELQRIETDFFIFTLYGAFIVEIDGDSHREKSHFEEMIRLEPFKCLDVEIYRIRPDLSDPEWADKEVIKFLKFASIKNKRR